MSEFRLPRLPRNVRIVDGAGNPTVEFQRWWQSVVTTLEAQEAAQNDIIADIVTAQAAATAAQAAAVTAQAAAVAAQDAVDEAVLDIGIIDERTTTARQFLEL